jgi:pantoate kinase
MGMISEGFAPAHITGFFFPHIEDDPLRTGSYGAGLALNFGAYSTVEISDGEGIEVKVLREGSSEVTRRALEIALSEIEEKVSVKAIIVPQLPIGQGFGMSAAGTLATMVAFADLMGMEKEDALRWTHMAEVKSGTGLSDAIGSYYGGMVIRKKPGMPPYGEIEKVPIEGSVWCMMLGEPISTKEFLMGYEMEKLREPAMDSLSRLLDDPNLQRFVQLSRSFADAVEISEDVLKKIPAGAMGSQIMLGNSVFFINGEGGIKCGVDNEGARLVG